jgi:dihydroorotate dehydrogenase (NAD+) catalytic subunit
MGHSGGGDIFPLNLLPSYRKIAKEIRDEGTTIIAKSATRHYCKGNYRWYAPGRCIKRITKNGDVGLLNSFGLTNDGVAVCAKRIRASIERGFNVIPSYFVNLKDGLKSALKETEEAVEIYSTTLNEHFRAFEYNASCPNSGESLRNNEQHVVTVAKHALSVSPPNMLFIVKMSPLHSIDLALALQEIGVHVLHCLNTFPHSLIFPNEISPLAKLGGGGYSGEFMFEKAFKINRYLRTHVRIPMILGCGISNREHAQAYWSMVRECDPESPIANNSIAICSVIRNNPAEARKLIKLYS